MRKALFYFIFLTYFVFYGAFLSQASPEDEAEKDILTTIEEQPLKTQAKKYKWELSTAASLSINKEKNGPYRFTETVISIPFRMAYCIDKNLEIEPEINYWSERWDYRIYHGSDWKLFLLVNLVANFNTSHRIVPFVLLGAGMMKFPEESEIEPYNEWVETKFCLHAGAGLKLFATKRVAIRVEYRLMGYSENTEYDFQHKIFTGISLFF
jgi:opacity protein-like surface antigen